MFGRIFTSFSQYLPRLPGLLNSTLNSPYTVTNQGNLISVRTRMRYHFPHPNERKRIKRHGYWARMATPKGRNILRRKFLKGKWILGH